MKQVGIYELKTKISALVAEVEATGRGIALTKHGRVVAELVPPRQIAPKSGMLKSEGFFVAEDFDEDSSAFEELFAEAAPALPPRLAKVAEDPAPYRVNPKMP
jgi:antitoxin (DNA-binding transcriptional repressor) of toxin-antitoxin stability system